MKSRILSVLKYLIGWPVSIISLAYIVSIIYSNKNSFFSIKSLNFSFLILSILCFFVYFLLRGFLWHKIIEEKGNKLSFKDTVYFWEISEIKRYTPGNIWSFLSRSVLFTDNNLTNKDVFSSIVNEMALIVLSCLLLSLFYISLTLKEPFFNGIILVLTFVLIVMYIFIGKLFKYFPPWKIFAHIKNYILPGETSSSNFKLYVISVAAFAMFGLATYFSAVSIFYLSIKNISELVSLFVFSLLIGYLSVITPMGLGVREGVMTLGLLRFLTASAAGLVSIFTRIIFIVSEVIFLILTILWVKTKYKLITNTEKFVKKHKQAIILTAFIILYILYFTVASFLRYNNFYTGRFDLGNMDQTVWNTIHGRIFQMTNPNGTNIVSRLAFHADFILVLISPLYLIWSDPRMLLLFQTVVLALGAIFVYKLSNELLKNKNFSLALSVAYLLNPALQYTNLYDFHPVTLATTLLLITFYCFLKKKYLLFVVFAILAGITKEQIWAIVAIFGFAILVRSLYQEKQARNYREIILGLIVTLSSSFIFYELIWKIIPYFNGGNHFALAYYSDFGGSASQIVENILLKPVKVISIILHPDNLGYLTQLFGPVGFLPVFALPVLIFAAPDLAINLLSNNLQLHQIYYQYSASITPFIFISTIYAVKFIRSKRNISFNIFSGYILATTLIVAYVVGPLPGSFNPNVDMFTNQLTDQTTIDNFLNSIPKKYSIAATNNLGSHLSRRQNIYTIPLGIKKADVILFLLNDAFAQPSLSAQKQMVQEMREDKNYLEVYSKGDFVVFEKRSLYTKPTYKQPKKGETNLFPYSITALEHRNYNASNVTTERSVQGGSNFSSYVVSYLSDGLKEYALMNVPNTPEPAGGYPVVIVDHGYIIPNEYSTVSSYSEITNYFASEGFLVLKPDYRGNGYSQDNSQALMRFAYPIDVLNLLSSLQNIPNANPNQVFLWSHSMGGEVTLEVLEVASSRLELDKRIKAAVFWAPVTDPIKWFSANHLPQLPEYKLVPFPYAKTFEIMGTPEQNPKLWNTVSPLNYLSGINVPILLQHGTGDNTVPYSWSEQLYNDLLKLKKNALLTLYSNDNHNLTKNTNKALNEDLSFYLSHLNP